jgi:signal transduction histidine kinase
VRLRLALWHTAALAVLLLTFALGAYAFVVRTARQRVDRMLAETGRLFVQRWGDEQVEEGSSPTVAARDAAREVRYRDARVLLYDRGGTLVAISDSVPLTAGLPVARLARVRGSPLARLVAGAAPERASFTTLGARDAWVRAAAVGTTYAGAPYTVVVLQGLGAEEEARETFAGWLLTTIPLALLVAGVGGYLLARASLAPVVTMGAQAERISADSLHARLAVRNPHDELGQLAGVLNRLLARLERAFAQQRQFMADASHELRTPVTVVRSAADIALDQSGQTVDELRDALRVVSGQGRRLTRIVEDLFLLARADSGQQPVHRELLFLEEVLADAAAAGRALGQQRSVAVHAAPADEAPFRGDAALLGRLLLNLVDNAVKHPPAGGQVRLALAVVGGATLPDGTALPGRWYRLSVEDTGGGVAPAVRETLFERFTRADAARGHDARSATGGAGLGLAIVRWIAEAHDGRVVLEATGLQGSRFVVWLPVLDAGLGALRSQ